MTMVACGSRFITASRISSADSTRVTSAAEGGVSECVSHASTGTVGEIADGIDLLASGTGGDQHGFALQVLRRAESFQHCGDDGFVFRQASGAGHATGKISGSRFHDLDAALTKNLEIRPRRGMIPHIYVHRRGNDNGGGGREKKCGQEIGGDSLREVGENV